MATGNIVKSKLSAKKATFRLATWNIQGGIQSAQDSELLISDFQRYKIHIACLQETRCGAYTYANDFGKIICLEADEGTPAHQKYGQGFYICNDWFQHFYGVRKISNRISVIQFHINRTRSRRVKLTIINVYSPTSKLISSNPDAATAFYDTLHQTIDKYERQSYLTYIVGDFNSKLGTQLDDTEAFVGQYGKGTRNRNGHLLTNFLAEHQYFAANTIFKHHMRHRSTWYGYIQGKHIYNQIDYILVPMG